MTMDISNIMYLNTPLKDFQCMRFHIDLIPEEVIEEYNIRDKVDRTNNMVGYTVKFERPFTGLKRVTNLPMYNYKRYSPNEDIIHVHSPRAYTSMNPDQSHSPSSLTILESNMSGKKMWTI